MPRRLQALAVELRKLVEEQDAVVGQADLAGRRRVAASRALGSGTSRRGTCREAALIAIDSAPRIGRTVPSSASSPAMATLSNEDAGIWPGAASRASAIGRSNAPASFLSSAGARLMTALPGWRR